MYRVGLCFSRSKRQGTKLGAGEEEFWGELGWKDASGINAIGSSLEDNSLKVRGEGMKRRESVNIFELSLAYEKQSSLKIMFL